MLDKERRMAMDVKPKLLDQVRDRLRLQHKSYHTERQYLIWIAQYVAFCNRHEPEKSQWRHPKDCGRQEVEAFLTYLAVEKHVASSTQNQAFSALMYLYREILNQPLEQVKAIRAKKPEIMPAVFSREEAIAVATLYRPLRRIHPQSPARRLGWRICRDHQIRIARRLVKHEEQFVPENLPLPSGPDVLEIPIYREFCDSHHARHIIHSAFYMEGSVMFQ